MKKLLRNYPQAVLIALAAVFAALIIAAYAWGIGNVITAVNGAVNSPRMSTSTVGFDLKGAAQLDLRGLVGK